MLVSKHKQSSFFKQNTLERGAFKLLLQLETKKSSKHAGIIIINPYATMLKYNLHIWHNPAFF